MSNEKKHNIMDDLSSMASSTMTTISNMKQDIASIVAEQIKAFMAKMDFVTKSEFDALKKAVQELSEGARKPASRSSGDRRPASRSFGDRKAAPRRTSEGRGPREDREGRGGRDAAAKRRISESRRDGDGRREREDSEERGGRRPAGRSFGRKSESSEGRRFGGRSSDSKRPSKSFGAKRSESAGRERDDRSSSRRPKLSMRAKKAAS